MLGAALFFSIMGALVKHVSHAVPSTEIVFLRAVTSIIFVTPVMIFYKIRIIPENLKIVFIRSLSGFIALCLNFYILSKLNLADASLFNRTSVLFVAVFSVIFLKEKVGPKLVTLILISFTGVLFILKPSLDVINIAGLAGLGVGILAAVAYISIKILHDSEHFLTIVLSTAIFSTIASAIFFGHNFIMPSLPILGECLAIGVLGTAAQIMLTLSYKYDKASIVTPYSFAMVLFASLWGILFWQEIPDLYSIIGGCLLIGASIGILKLREE